MNLSSTQAIKISDSEYPKLLKNIDKPPGILYVRGNLEVLNSETLAVIGSRKMSQYGKNLVPSILTPAVKNGLVTVSGLAYGIDSLAHRISVTEKSPTIAVLGTGVDDENIYPKAHVSLAHEIIENGGCVISEYAPGTTIYKTNFIARNRIIAGISMGVLVVEAAKKSGTLITVGFALDYNRDVLAVPGSIFSPLSEGTNQLIKEGATVITSSDDLLNYLGIETKLKQKTLFSGNSEIIVKALKTSPLSVDSLHLQTGLPVPEILSLLSTLEMDGVISREDQETFIMAK